MVVLSTISADIAIARMLPRAKQIPLQIASDVRCFDVFTVRVVLGKMVDATGNSGAGIQCRSPC